MKRKIFILFFWVSMVSVISVMYTRTRQNSNNTVTVQQEVVTEKISEDEFNQEAKRKSVIGLVERGMAHFNKNRMEDVGQVFTHTKDFIEGELYLFVFDMNGNVFAHGKESNLLWKNLWELRDDFGSFVVQMLVEKAKNGGGWVTYEWRGAVKVSYVQKVTKKGKDYIIGSGYYPHSKSDAVVGLVRGAVAMFNRVLEQKFPIDVAFSLFSYPMSERFIRGDLYLYALDFEGVIRAQGDRPGLIGSNAWNYKDKTGKFVNQEIVNKLKQTDQGIWIDYVSKNTKKHAYAEKVTDTQGNEYFIACGYYPEADRNATVDLVRRGYQFMKASGISMATKEFTEKRTNTFRYGDLFLILYDFKGKCIAHGKNEEWVGQNHWDRQDEDGRYYIREMVEKAKQGGGWIDIKRLNSFASVYVEKIDMGTEEFVIASGLYPISKNETMTLLVKSGAGYLQSTLAQEAFRAFVDKEGKFIRGDLFIFVFDQEGFCYAYGDNYKLIWRNLLGWKDDNGKPFVKILINTARQGPGKVTYILNKRPFVSYVQQVEKNGKVYVVGSGFYQ